MKHNQNKENWVELYKWYETKLKVQSKDATCPIYKSSIPARLFKSREAFSKVDKMSASSGNRTRVTRVGGENSTIEPTMLTATINTTKKCWPELPKI